MKTLIIILFIVACISSVFCQVEMKDNIKFIYENDILTTIEFKNEGVSNFDVQLNNPYNKLNHPTKGLNSSGAKIYDLSQFKTEDVIKPSINAIALNNSSLKTPINIASSSFSFFRGENNILVAYQLNYFGDESIIYSEGTIVVLDNKGNVVNKIEDIPYGCYSPRITENGASIAFLQGDIQAHSNFSLVDIVTFIIKDLASGRTIFELRGDSDFSIYEPVVYKNLIIEVIKFPGNEYEYQVFDPERRIVYKKRYTREEIGKLKAYKSTGFLFEDKNRREKIELFEDFRIESF